MKGARELAAPRLAYNVHSLRFPMLFVGCLANDRPRSKRWYQRLRAESCPLRTSWTMVAILESESFFRRLRFITVAA